MKTVKGGGVFYIDQSRKDYKTAIEHRVMIIQWPWNTNDTYNEKTTKFLGYS